MDQENLLSIGKNSYELDHTALQTQDSKFAPWGSEAEHATFWSRMLPHNTEWAGKKHF